MGRPRVAEYEEGIIPNNIKYHPQGREGAADIDWMVTHVKEESERSYTPALTEKEFKVIIAFLSFESQWAYLIVVCTFLVLFIQTYSLLFHDLFQNIMLAWIFFFVQVFGILDIVINIIHYKWKDIAEQKTHKVTNKYLLMVDALAGAVLLPISFGKAILVHYFESLPDSPAIFMFIIIMNHTFNVLIVYRMLRVSTYIFHLTNTPAKQTMKYVILKYGTFLMIILHSAACLWRYMGCFEPPDKCKARGWSPTWTTTLQIAYSGANHISHYFMCILYIIGAITCNGIGGPANANDGEYIIMIVLMILGIFVINGLYLGAFTAMQIERYTRMSMFSNKLQLISQNLSHPNVPKALRQSIIKYYILFWHREGALRKSSLFFSLPASIQIEVHLDRYWKAFNKSYLLKDLHYGLKRAISNVMYTKILNPGEMIVFQETVKKTLIYVERGNIDVLSPDDGESPIVTFSVGSCISEMSLMYNYPSPTSLVASSYCVLHCLDKHELWRMVNKYRKLKQHSVLHETTRRIVQFAKIAIASTNKRKVKTKPLARVKEKLISYSKTKDKDKVPVAFDIYVIREKESTGQTADTVFLRTTWPWILHPQSQFLLLWEIVITINVVVVSLIYPYVVITTLITSNRIHYLYVYTYMLYIIDLMFKIFTAVEDKIGYHTNVARIISTRCTNISFILDMFSLVPFYLIFAIFDQGAHTDIAHSVSHLNHMLKLYRFFDNLNVLSNTLNVNVHFLRRVKYVLYLGYASYISGCAYFIVGCPFEYCGPEYWIHSIINKSKKYSEADLILKSMHLAIAVISGTGGDVYYVNIYDIAVLIIQHVCFILIFTYLVADYSATLTLDLRSREVFVEMVNAMRMFMKSNNMDPSIHQRMDNYFATQWTCSHGVTMQALMQDCPPTLYENQLIAKYYRSYITVPLFKFINNLQIISKIAAKSDIVFLPPNEYICYAGDFSNAMYIIEEGYCEIITPSSGLVERIVGPMSYLCLLEMLLKKPKMYNIRTMTDVNLIKINWSDIRSELVQHGILHSRIKEAIEYVRDSQAGKRLFAFRVEFRAVVGKTTKPKSFFNFPEEKLHPLDTDYHRAWRGYGIARYLLRRHTILPDGDFLYFYSIFRAVCAITSGLVFPHIFLLQQIYPQYIMMPFSFMLFFTALVDIYVRLHICYYNDIGILVTHPRYTARHYLTSAFAVDIFGMIPLDLLFNELSNFCDPYTMIVLNYNRILQMYRAGEGIAIFYRDILAGQRLWANLIKFISITISMISFVSSILLVITCNIEYVKGDGFKIKPYNDVWISRYAVNKRNNNDINSPYYLGIMSFYFTTNNILQLGNTDISADATSEIYLTILVFIAGYLWFTYVLVFISNSKALVNTNLTLYQNYMKGLINYMNVEDISKDVKERTIRHFEFMWQRTHGIKHNTIISRCHHALAEDCVLQLYEDTMNKMPILIDMDKSFYRRLGLYLTEAYFLPGFTIIQLNDIIDTMYIIHRGEVNVFGPDKSWFAVLGKGSAFGHLDNTSHTRSMTTVKASNTVFLLTMKTTEFYDVTKTNPVIHHRLEKHITVINCSYVEREPDKETMKKSCVKINDNRSLTKTERMFYTSKLYLIYMISYYISFCCQSYQIAFQDTHIAWFIVSYMMDAIHVTKIVLGFYTPFTDALGNIMTHKRVIKMRNIRSCYFYLDVLTVIPTECFSALLQSKDRLIYFIYLRSNRLLRVGLFGRYFKVIQNYLNAPVLVIKLSSVLVYFTLILHLQTCVWYMVGCPNSKCLPTEWTFNLPNIGNPLNSPSSVSNNITATDRVCSNYYVCALYFSTSISTFAGFPNATGRTELSIVLVTWFAISLKILISIFIGDIAAIVRYFAYTMGNYAHHIQNLKVYLQNGNISHALKEKVISYVGQLWDKSKGHQIPYLLTDAPMHVIAEIKTEAYGKYIFENFVFLKCHPDFLRLLITHLEPVTFFTSNNICHHGDINDSMYFIHKGRVEAYLHSEHIDFCVDELRDGDCFGMIQGLYPNTPHSHTYIATTVTVILKLKLSKWRHLLLFYPATKYEIYDKISSL